jgi:L-ascorbate metabolism protein UlaG (beta-lactamase superfamily)
MHRIAVALVVTLQLLLGCGGGEVARTITVTYIGNEGFMVEMGGTKVLVDALSRSEFYASPSDSLVRALMEGRPPYDGIGHLLVTHPHPDHFNRALVSGFLRSNAATRFIAAGPVCDRMVADGIPAAQCSPINLALGERAVIRDGHTEVMAVRLPHGWNPEEENLAFLVKAHGRTVLHVGDALLTAAAGHLRTLPWDSLSVDILFLEFFDRSSETQEIIEQLIRPAVVVLMHIPPGEEDTIRNAQEKVHPRTVVFAREGEARTFEFLPD